MVKFDVEGSQNVEVSRKIACEKPLVRQLEIMEKYTEVHKNSLGLSKEMRELNCLKVIYPEMFRSIEDGDLIAGRLDFLPIGFGTVTSVGGVGHYCVFSKLREFQREISEIDSSFGERVEKLYQYWLDHDLKTQYCRRVLTETTVGRFIDTEYPLIATARLSGMMLDYPKLLENGIGGLEKIIKDKLALSPDNEFYKASLGCLELVPASADCLAEKAREQLKNLPVDNEKRRKELADIIDSLCAVRKGKPQTFHQALQLIWLYAMLAGVINYGRLDDFLGVYLANDLEKGILTELQAYDYIKSLWTMIENRRTTVNGRVIVGGKGRKHPKEADIFLHIAMKACHDCRYVEPQFTLRIDSETTEENLARGAYRHRGGGYLPDAL